MNFFFVEEIHKFAKTGLKTVVFAIQKKYAVGVVVENREGNLVATIGDHMREHRKEK